MDILNNNELYLFNQKLNQAVREMRRLDELSEEEKNKDIEEKIHLNILEDLLNSEDCEDFDVYNTEDAYTDYINNEIRILNNN